MFVFVKYFVMYFMYNGYGLREIIKLLFIDNKIKWIY